MTKKNFKRSSETKIPAMRQGQTKIKLNLRKSPPTSPPLPLPFPPTQRVEQIVAKLVAKPRLVRFPNAFIMYRNEYVQYLKSQGIHISMTELSPMISTSWKKESEFVKETYTRLSSDAEKMYIRDTGSSQQQINYKYLPNQKSSLSTTTTTSSSSSKFESEIIPKLNDPPHQSQLHTSNFTTGNDILNIYDRLLQYSNGFSRNYLKDSDEIPSSFSIGTSELAKYSLDNISLSQAARIDGSITQQDGGCFSTDNIFQWNNIPSPVVHNNLPPVSYGSSYSSNNTTLDDLQNIIEFSSLEAQMLESLSTSSVSSPPSESSLDEMLLFSPELDDGGFPDFTTSTYSECQSPLSPLQSSDLYLYSGQSFATPPNYHNKI
ncbi:hypothetical protein C1645_779994 [Glomus cerebriforme]|uniref:HMG box domain-containing protein n=1 Tax=Glomus cerebriforme TaxID=658196 RepID=A0A397STP1_9GLOM|nr:hypothetical protein C1645_779994 [Glomus cerebriforme]